MHLLLAAGAQAVHAVNNPALHVNVVQTPDDPIARKTLDTAVRTFWATVIGIGIATIAAGIALYDVIRNTNQVRDFMRRPDLTAAVTFELELPNAAERPYRGAWMGAYVKNIGKRAVRNYALEVLVPHSYLKSGWDTTNSRSIYGTGDYVAFTWVWDDKPFYPNANPHYRAQSFEFKKGTDDNPKVLWRILDDYGTYPKDKPYGDVEVRLGN